MKKVAICGHFGFGKTLLNGQTVKTKIVTDALVEGLGSSQIKKIDTHGNKLQIIKAVLSAVGAMFTCRNLVILPAHNGVRVFGPVLAGVGRIAKCKLHYVVIGGWLPEMLKSKPSLARALKRFGGIYVETSTLQKSMEAMGFQNVYILPNCKSLNILTPEEMVVSREEPFRLCTFSRVLAEKGIEDAAEAIIKINENCGRTACALDIYGPVDPAYEERFSELRKAWPEAIQYKGCVDFDKSVDVLKEYFLLLFPSRFFTEGIPGTIIDAYAAGVPVVSAKWESCMDMVDDQTGFIYPFGDKDALRRQLEKLITETELVIEKKTACLKRAADYLPCNGMGILLNSLE